MSVYRCYSQKKPGFDVEAQGLCKALREQLGVAGLTSVAILNRYDADQIDPAVYQQAKGIVFSEPQVDVVYDETFPQPAQPCALLAVEALPGQFDQRADSCAQCIQLMAGVERPLIAYAKVYVLQGQLSQEDLSKIRHYLINPVESREASMDKPETLVRTHETPDHVPTIDGFISMDEKALAALLVLALSLPVFADMGPKPSVTLKLYYTPGQRYAVTLLGNTALNGPWTAPADYRERMGSRETWEAFRNYPAGRRGVRLGLLPAQQVLCSAL